MSFGFVLSLPAENWRLTEVQRDSRGHIIHSVELDAESAQDVLNALQAAVFTGELPECSLQVRKQGPLM